ncbi:MAG TPA: hypothetical protein VL361_20160 [Candidatus Limnocylindrales bacterium]|nr:hypothetical protein [Candidatus Limnocylindrales bacterium]
MIASDFCAVCGTLPSGSIYLMTDAVTAEKVTVCTNCAAIYPNCYLCSLPANTNSTGFVRLPDERSLCARDAKTAVLDEDEAIRVCREVRDELDRVLWRFMSFPETNVVLAVVDRVHLMDLFKLAGNDYHCPNVLGYTQASTNHSRIEYRISLMSGLLPGWFRATCAHEYTHTWVHQHLSAHRKETFGRDAEEGFCELIAYMLMDAQHDEAQKARILRNPYTRGQIDLFVAARDRYGFNDVLDWVQYGADASLNANDPSRVRKLEIPAPSAISTVNFAASNPEPRRAPTSLELKAVFWNPSKPVAIINNYSFTPLQEATVPLAGSNITVRCLSIRPDAVTIRIAGSPRDQTLHLKR